MPRKARLSPAASFFHVMTRGIEGRDIFDTDEDRERFLGPLSAGLNRTGYCCYAWAPMQNHYHLVPRSSDVHLSALMGPLNAAYAQGFSNAHSRTGYLAGPSKVRQNSAGWPQRLCAVPRAYEKPADTSLPWLAASRVVTYSWTRPIAVGHRWSATSPPSACEPSPKFPSRQ